MSADSPINIPTGCYRQPNESNSVDESGNDAILFILKGDYSSLDTLRGTLFLGKLVESGTFAKSWNLQRLNGDVGLLTITCSKVTQVTPGESGQKIPIKDTWTIHNVRNDRSVYAYCGDSVGANPLREQVEQWAKEPDATLAANFQFREPDGTITTLTAPSEALAAKMAAGVESVVRFYPVITRKRIYTEPPADCLESIGYKDTPPDPESSISPNAKKPSGLADKISSYQWLKMQDDVDEQTDGNWIRTESWWGAESWDDDLYGSERWGFPADLT